MASVVLDTTVLIDHLRGTDRASSWLLGLPESPHCSEVTRTEILQGLRSPERAAAEALFAGIGWVPVDEQVSRLAGELGRRYRRSHGIGAVDLIVAATAQLLGVPVATQNVRHFPMFVGLRPPYEVDVTR